MKLRIGFVSNSSSVSFCVYGTRIESKDIKKLFSECNSVFDAEHLASEFGLETHLSEGECKYSDGYIYFGKSWCKIKDNETGLKFKKDVENKLEKLFKKKVECQTYEDGYYNG